MKRIKLTQLTIVPSMLDATTPAQPNGAIHAAITREYAVGDATGEVVYTRDSGDASITRADLVQRARALWADCVQYLADENAIPVKGAEKDAVVQPKARA